jgi:hypothetical protein
MEQWQKMGGKLGKCGRRKGIQNERTGGIENLPLSRETVILKQKNWITVESATSVGWGVQKVAK